MATKTSVLIFYLRLAKNTQLVLRYASWATLTVVNLAGFILTFINIFQCSPVQAAWNPFFTDGVRCIPLLTEFICSAPINIITDLAILSIPIPVLTGMRLPTRQKAILVFTFSLVVFVVVADVVRIYYLQQAIAVVDTGSSPHVGSTFGGQANFAWNASLSLMWSAVEVNVGMTCACIPTLKPLILKLLPAMLYDPDGTIPSLSKTPQDLSSRNRRNSSDAATPTMGSSGSDVRQQQRRQPSSDSRAGQQGDDGGRDGGGMTAMEFLTTPDMAHGGQNPTSLDAATRAQTNMTMGSTAPTTATTTENAVYFGFVNMARPKSMLRTSAAESVKYCTIVTVLFFLWGISYGLLNTLNNVVAGLNGMSPAQTLGLTSAYFGGGYLFGPIVVGEWILRRDEHNRSRRHGRNQDESVGGFKVTFIVGLSIYGIGTIIFYPSAVTNSYGGFMLSNFVVGFGLSVLEVGANAFMVLCGPPQHAETRLLVAQGVQGVGSVVSGLLANKIFFADIAANNSVDAGGGGFHIRSTALINVQWTYLGITLLCAALGLFFYYMPLPEVSDHELEQSDRRLAVDPKKKSIGGLQLRTLSLILAVSSQFMYVAAQESNSIWFRDLFISVLPHYANSGEDAANASAAAAAPDKPPGAAMAISDYLLVGHTAFAVSRFLFGYLTYLSAHNPRMPKPRTLLTISFALSFLFALLPVVVKPPTPDLLVIPIILFFFAEGPVWPLIFAIGLRGQGRRTKRAAAFITMGASGAGFVPFIMYGIIREGGTVKNAYIVIIVLQVLMMSYPIFLESMRDARSMVEQCPRAPEPSHDLEATADELVSERLRQSGELNEKRGSFLKRVSKSFGVTMGAKERPVSSPRPSVTHVPSRTEVHHFSPNSENTTAE
jgi:fucose permease